MIVVLIKYAGRMLLYLNPVFGSTKEESCLVLAVDGVHITNFHLEQQNNNVEVS